MGSVRGHIGDVMNEVKYIKCQYEGIDSVTRLSKSKITLPIWTHTAMAHWIRSEIRDEYEYGYG